MNFAEKLLVIGYALVNLLVFVTSIYESSSKKNVFKKTPFLFLIGVFVWGDGVVIGLFWLLISCISLFFQDWMFFLFTLSLFWVIRSFGEIVYWLNQQFSAVNRNPKTKSLFHRVFPFDSYWFAYQLLWQCALVISIIMFIFFGVKWTAGIN